MSFTASRAGFYQLRSRLKELHVFAGFHDTLGEKKCIIWHFEKKCVVLLRCCITCRRSVLTTSMEDRWIRARIPWRVLCGGGCPCSWDDIAYRSLRYVMKRWGAQSAGIRLV